MLFFLKKSDWIWLFLWDIALWKILVKPFWHLTGYWWSADELTMKMMRREEVAGWVIRCRRGSRSRVSGVPAGLRRSGLDPGGGHAGGAAQPSGLGHVRLHLLLHRDPHLAGGVRLRSASQQTPLGHSGKSSSHYSEDWHRLPWNLEDVNFPRCFPAKSCTLHSCSAHRSKRARSHQIKLAAWSFFKNSPPKPLLGSLATRPTSTKSIWWTVVEKIPETCPVGLHSL